MKILLVGHFNYPSSIGWQFLNILNQNNSVEVFDTAEPFYKYYNNVYNKVLFRLGFSNIIDSINKNLLNRIEEFKPAIILVFKGMELKSSTLVDIKRMGIKLMNYNPDHPFIFSGRGSGNDNVKNGFIHYDLHISYNKLLCEHIQSKYRIDTYWLPFGHGFDYSFWDKVKDVNEKKSVAFVGNPDKERIGLIKFLINGEIPVAVYGNNWEKYIDKRYVSSAVYELDFWEAIRSHRIQLNIFRKHNKGSHNMRTFDVPAVGGILLSPYNEEQEYFFKEDMHAFYYRSNEDLCKKIKFLLNEDFSTISKIRDNAFEMSKNHTYANRISEFNIFLESAI